VIERIAAEPGDGFIAVTTAACVMCKRKSRLNIPRDGYREWLNGALIQNALPDLTDDERELLLTGTHPDCWDIAFPDEED
jgi:hypothetical protein